MRLMIKQRVFSWTDSYDIYDENGDARYYVKAELFSFGHQIHVYEKDGGREVGSVHQKLLTFMPAFEIVIKGQTLGTVRKEFTFFHPRYYVDFCGWDVEGDIFGWDYEVQRNGVPVMSVYKEFFAWGDTYCLDIQNPADEMMALLLVIAIDAANCDK
ncbi:MAG: LURP-one-related family protein [Oscillospiraceae bacterium]|nr:LURP-one-related family protein [Oscillospiraceae bacterium]